MKTTVLIHRINNLGFYITYVLGHFLHSSLFFLKYAATAWKKLVLAFLLRWYWNVKIPQNGNARFQTEVWSARKDVFERKCCNQLLGALTTSNIVTSPLSFKFVKAVQCVQSPFERYVYCIGTSRTIPLFTLIFVNL